MGFPEPPPLPPELEHTPADRARSAPKPRPGKGRNESLQRLVQISVLGTNLAFTTGAGALVGWLLDRWLGTGPWLLLAIAGIATLGGLLRFFREARNLVTAGQSPAPSGRGETQKSVDTE